MKLLVNTDKFDALRKIADTFGKLRLRQREVTEVLMNPIDFYRLRTNPVFFGQFDAETQRVLIRKGTAGYLWGSVVKFAVGQKVGEFVFHTKALKGTK